MKLRPHITQDQWLEFHYGRPGDVDRRFERHFFECAQCREFAAGLATVRNVFQVEVPSPLPDKWARLQSAVLEDFRCRRLAKRPQLFQSLRGTPGRVWLFLTDDPLAAMAYTCAATGYLLYSLLNMSELQSLVPGPDQVLSLIRFVF